MGKIGHIFRWDLDKTYLKTEFASLRELVRTARLSAEQRENIPGSAALIRAIRAAATDQIQNLIFFLSGSPEQLRTVIERKFALDGFVPDGFVLKPAVSNLLRGRFRAVRSQVGYKLSELIESRTQAPIGTKETLFGDDAENDAFIYSLYADVVAGRVRGDELERVLKAAGAYQSQIDEVVADLEAVVQEDPVHRIVIHLDQHSPPVAFQHFFPRVVPIYNHLQTAIVLYFDGTLGPECIRDVGRELLDRYGFDQVRLTNLAEDILRRRRMHSDFDALPKLARDLRALPPESSDGSKSGQDLIERTQALITAIADRTEVLASRNPTDEWQMPPKKLDYVALWEKEQDRHEQQKRAKKLAGKISRDEEREALRRDPTPIPRS